MRKLTHVDKIWCLRWVFYCGLEVICYLEIRFLQIVSEVYHFYFMAAQGILKIHVHEARLSRDTETFGKMDPYCIFETRQQRVRTKMLANAGKTPNWMGEVVTIDVKYIGDDINLSVWDDDPGKDDLIGSA